MIISFISLWIIGFIIHEVGHWLGAVLTGGSAKIKFWLYKGFIPSMKTYPEGTYNRLIFTSIPVVKIFVFLDLNEKS